MESETDIPGKDSVSSTVEEDQTLTLSQSMFERLDADIMVMQEIKIQRKDLTDEMILVPGWDVFLSLPKYQKGYSGVAIYTKTAKCAPTKAEEGITGTLFPPKSSVAYRDLPEDEQIGGYPKPGQLSGLVSEADLDSEGRCVILEFPAFVLLGVYCPANRDTSRNDFKLAFFEALDVRVRNLVAAGKEVIVAGDLNVIRSVLDSTNVTQVLRKEGLRLGDWIALPSRLILNQLLFESKVVKPRDPGREVPVLWDLCRCFHPERKGMNTCWDTKKNARPSNNGSRIDYIFCSAGLKNWFVDANIQEGLMGSDHCPVFVTMGATVPVNGCATALAELMNPVGMFKGGERMRDWTLKDSLPMSERLLSDTHRRQSIRELFFLRPGFTPRERKPSLLLLSTSDEPDTELQPTAQISESASNGAAPAEQESGVSRNNPAHEGSTTAVSASRPKRRRDAPNHSKKSHKRVRSTTTPSTNKSKVNGGQKTLQGFLKPKSHNSSQAATSSMASVLPPLSPTRSSSSATREFDATVEVVQPRTLPSPTTQSSTPRRPLRKIAPKPVVDPIEARESWAKLLGGRPVPRCEHDEPCISLLTRKGGVNRGTFRIFLQIPHLKEVGSLTASQGAHFTSVPGRWGRLVGRRRTPSGAAGRSSGAVIGAAGHPCRVVDVNDDWQTCKGVVGGATPNIRVHGSLAADVG